MIRIYQFGREELFKKGAQFIEMELKLRERNGIKIILKKMKNLGKSMER
jgi:hypothetical protein